MAVVMPCFGGYYRNMSGIIGFFNCVTKALIHSNEQLIFHDKKINIYPFELL